MIRDDDGQVVVLADGFAQALATWRAWMRIVTEDDESTYDPVSVECLETDAVVCSLVAHAELGKAPGAGTPVEAVKRSDVLHQIQSGTVQL